MIQVIEKIDRIGALDGFDGSAHSLARLSLIYAGNGTGKSTLAAVLAAAGSGDTGSISERQSLGTTRDAHVRLSLSVGKLVLNKAIWNGSAPPLHVFDSEFVDRNVHTGGRVDPSHRKRLLELAIGKTAVDEQEHSRIAAKLADDTKVVKERIESEILSMAHAVDRTCSLSAFEKIRPSGAEDAEVSRAETALTDGKNIAAINALPLPTEMAVPTYDLGGLFDALSESFSALHSAARLQVTGHLDQLHGKPRSDLEAWLREGITIAHDNECPYCGQSTSQVTLVDMYADFFDSEYDKLRTKIDRLFGLLGGGARQKERMQLNAEYERASTFIDAWKTHVDTPTLPHLTPILDEMDNLGGLIDSLFTRKMENFDRSIDSSADRPLIETFSASIVASIEKINIVVREARAAIESYKASLAAHGVPQLNLDLNAARLAQLRASNEVQELFAKRNEARLEHSKADKSAAEARKTAREAMDATLGAFEVEINKQLRKMGAQFTVEEVTSTNAGGGSRGNYALKLRGESINISSGKPAFRTALSEGDKRALAFAFFCARLLAETDLLGHVVVVDDPVTSLDKHRRTHTTNILNDLSMRGAQVIILAHDATYLREVREKFDRKEFDNHGSSRTSVELYMYRDSGGNASLGKHDLDRECESPYFRHHRRIRAFLDAERIDGAMVSHTEAGIAIRPLVEGYLHRRFPGHIPKSKRTLGAVVNLIDASPPDSVLSFAKTLVSELTDMNEFGMRYHHDTGSDSNEPEPDAAEVEAFAERALRLVLGAPVP